MSRVREAVRSAIEAQESPVPDYNKKVTLRIGAIEYYKLHKLAEAMGQSKTGCAEHLLGEALQDGWEAAGLVWDQEDASEFLGQHAGEVQQQFYNEQLVRNAQSQQLVEGAAA